MLRMVPGVQLPHLPLCVPLADRHGSSLPSWLGGFDSRKALHENMIGDRLAVGPLALNQATEVRPLLPELTATHLCLDEKQFLRSHSMVG
jgi:hypothetical protein